MSKRSYQITTPTLPVEQYDHITNWMSDLPPLAKKPRAIHPRQRGHFNKQQQQHKQQHQHQHQQQYRQQHEPHQHQQTTVGHKSNSHQAPLQPIHSSIDDGLPKGRDFPLKEERLEHQRMREMHPLDNNPKFVKSLDYSLTMDCNQWCLSEETVIKNKVTGQTITVPTDTLPVIPDFSLVPAMNLWRLRSRNANERSYEVAHKTLGCRIHVPFSNLTAFPENTANMAETISTTDLVLENSTFRRQLWESENALADLQSQLSTLQISAKTTNNEKELMRKKLVVCSKTLEIRDTQLKTLIKKSNELIEANQSLAKELKALKFIKNN